MTPRSVAASVSMSSTPTVYFATTRSRCEACMMRRVIGVWRMDVPISATASRAASTTASSCAARGNCQSWLPSTISQPSAFDCLDGLRRLLARRKDQDFRLGHAGSVGDWPGTAGALLWRKAGREAARGRLGDVSAYEQWCRQGAFFIGPTTCLVNVVIRSIAQMASFCGKLVGNVGCSLSLRVAHGPYRHRRLARGARIVLGAWRAVARNLEPPVAVAVRDRGWRRVARRPLVRCAGELRRRSGRVHVASDTTVRRFRTASSTIRHFGLGYPYAAAAIVGIRSRSSCGPWTSIRAAAVSRWGRCSRRKPWSATR